MPDVPMFNKKSHQTRAVECLKLWLLLGTKWNTDSLCLRHSKACFWGDFLLIIGKLSVKGIKNFPTWLQIRVVLLLIMGIGQWLKDWSISRGFALKSFKANSQSLKSNNSFAYLSGMKLQISVHFENAKNVHFLLLFFEIMPWRIVYPISHLNFCHQSPRLVLTNCS